MEIVIDISEEDYEKIKKISFVENTETMFNQSSEDRKGSMMLFRVIDAIKDATPLEAQPTEKCKGCYYNDGETRAECVVCDKEAQPTDADYISDPCDGCRYELNSTNGNPCYSCGKYKLSEQQPTLDTRQRERQLEMEYQHGYDKGWEEGRKALEQQPTSDDEIIKALKAVRTFHNGNYAPQIDEAIRRLTMPKSAYVQVNLSDERIQKAVDEAVEKMKAEIEAQPCEPCEDCISREAVIKNIKGWFDKIELNPDILIDSIVTLPSATPQRPKGRWEYVQYDYNPNIGNWHCSECRNIVIECVNKNDEGGIPIYKYCPNCGAEMSGGGEDEDSD